MHRQNHLFQLAGLAVLFAVLLCALPSRAQDAPAYGVEVRGVEDTEVSGGRLLADVLLQASDVFALRGHEPGSPALLRIQAREDVERLKAVLEAFGFFKAAIRVEVREDADGASPPPPPEDVLSALLSLAPKPPPPSLQVVFHVTPGPRFTFAHVRIDTTPATASMPGPDELGLSGGEPYDAQAVLDARDAMLKYLRDHGRPFPELDQMRVTADHETDTVDVRLSLACGPAAVFGETGVAGLDHVSEDFVLTLLPWTEGELYNASLLEKSRTMLLSTGLFSLVSLSPESVDTEGRASILVEVSERAPRTVRAGVGYSTDNGPVARAGWEHRTLMGNGEHFSAEAEAGLMEQNLTIDLTTPFFLTAEDSFHAGLDISRERRDAFEADQVAMETGISRNLDRLFTGLEGRLALRYALSREYTDTGDYGFLSLPATLVLDRRDDLLDPARGFALSLALEPALDTFRNGDDFLRLELEGSAYLPLDGDARFVLAGRMRYGALLGASLEGIPPHLRFYAGGGDSVRGYAYQNAGELALGDPVGGLSALEGSAEARIRLSEDFGLMVFLDAGRAYASHTPDTSQPLFVGTGIGLRYFSFFGPISLDVGFPLNRRDGDDAFQLYFGLGQSF